MFAKYFLLAACLSTVLASVAVPQVAPKSAAVKSVVGNYYFATEKVTFTQAWAYCRNAGLSFLSITTVTQNSALAEALRELGASTTQFWIGGLYLRNGFLNKWYWVDGQQDFSYTNWTSTPVVSSYEYATYFAYDSSKRTGSWGYATTATTKYFICQY